MEETKHLRDITLLYDRLHPKLHSRTNPGQHEREVTERKPADIITERKKKN